ncbi:endolytic transglycosylase MltG [Nocardioides pantholopis]|uniref:endolytic transglycosylase MltG n=1 Tax=Nocardioides pantholopis TaxID=2483798 RepID=UPI000F07FA55|nr:endolytic transglycosylase MltG [Nocardioides pantholopis]
MTESQQNDRLEEPPADEPEPDEGPAYVPGGRRRRRRSRLPGCLVALLVLAVVAGGLYWGVNRGIDAIQDQFGEPEDYPGPGSGSVAFEVVPGDSVTQMGRNLKEAGVVASVDAFTAAAADNPESTAIQAGFFTLRKKMAAAEVVEVLVDPANVMTTSVTVPEGLRLSDVVGVLAESTDFSRAAFEKALAKPEELGLPDYAGGNAEGYLFPATYAFGPNEKPLGMLQQMVSRWRQAADSADLEGAAKRLGYTPHELMTIASLVEAEGRGDDMPKIARVIYNRLENPGTAGTIGKLQIDATVNYAAGNKLGAVPTLDDLELDSPYNTYLNAGLPPGPIEAPGDAAIAAAAAPAAGDWYYYVTVNLATGETKFAETPEQFTTYKNELREYCATESEGAC